MFDGVEPAGKRAEIAATFAERCNLARDRGDIVVNAVEQIGIAIVLPARHRPVDQFGQRVQRIRDTCIALRHRRRCRQRLVEAVGKFGEAAFERLAARQPVGPDFRRLQAGKALGDGLESTDGMAAVGDRGAIPGLRRRQVIEFLADIGKPGVEMAKCLGIVDVLQFAELRVHRRQRAAHFVGEGGGIAGIGRHWRVRRQVLDRFRQRGDARLDTVHRVVGARMHRKRHQRARHFVEALVEIAEMRRKLVVALVDQMVEGMGQLLELIVHRRDWKPHRQAFDRIADRADVFGERGDAGFGLLVLGGRRSPHLVHCAFEAPGDLAVAAGDRTDQFARVDGRRWPTRERLIILAQRQQFASNLFQHRGRHRSLVAHPGDFAGEAGDRLRLRMRLSM